MQTEKMFICQVLMSGRVDEENKEIFLQCKDEMLSSLFKNGSVNYESFARIHKETQVLYFEPLDEKQNIIRLIEKPYGPLKFSIALEISQMGFSIQREGWNGKGLIVKYHEPKKDSGITEKFMTITYPDGRVIPWVPSQSDMMADDWFVVE